MATSLYDLSVASYLQILPAVSGFLDKGLAHSTAVGIDPDEIVQARLAPDMLPFSFQIDAVVHQSLGAIDGLKRGVFGPPGELPARDYAELQRLVKDTIAALQAINPADINALEGRDMAFEMRGRQVPFTTETFVMSFSLPNFYFHAATAYDILRHKGVALGKRDFLGPLRTRPVAA
jgi:uncharacterized protein